ncbi:nitronate monooxygenase [Chloroflexota bacterium]
MPGELGIIGTAHFEPDWVRQQIQQIRQLTKRPFGLNIILTSPFAEAIIGIAIKENVVVVATSAGKAERYIPRLRQAEI